MVITEREAILILVLISYYFHHEGVVIDNPVAEGLGEVKLARKIGGEFPNLSSHVEMALKGE